MTIFEQARAKIDRANTHIIDLDGKIALLQRSDIATVEINPEFGNEVIRYDIKDERAIREMALIAGDAVHNLRCALDYAWFEISSKLVPGSIGKFTRFTVPATSSMRRSLRRN